MAENCFYVAFFMKMYECKIWYPSHVVFPARDRVTRMLRQKARLDTFFLDLTPFFAFFSLSVSELKSRWSGS